MIWDGQYEQSERNVKSCGMMGIFWGFNVDYSWQFLYLCKRKSNYNRIMKQQHAVIVLFVLIVVSGLTSFGSYKMTDSRVSNDMKQALALTMAEQYLNTMAFSHDGLIEQLKYEGFSDEDAGDSSHDS